MLHFSGAESLPLLAQDGLHPVDVHRLEMGQEKAQVHGKEMAAREELGQTIHHLLDFFLAAIFCC